MVNVQITGRSPSGSIIRGDPFPTASRAAIILNHARAISLQHNIARVAATGKRSENDPDAQQQGFTTYLPWEIQ